MWEISWNVRVFLFVFFIGGFFCFVLFSPPLPHTGATTALTPLPPFLVFIPSAFVTFSSPCSDIKELREVHGGEIQSPEDRANALPQVLNVIMS